MRQADAVAAAVEADCAPFLAVAAQALLTVEPPLTAAQLRALTVLQERPGINLAGLATELGVKSPTATQLCDRLEAAGLLRRTVAGHSRREVHLGLTRAGARLLGELSEHRRRHFAAVLRRMTEAERDALRLGMAGFAAAAPHAAADLDGHRSAGGRVTGSGL